MPTVFLSPSTQYYNLYATGGDERYYTNLIANAMIPYLLASGISYSRNDPSGTVGTSVALSNAGNYDLHLAIHSNAGPESMAGRLRGTDVYYYPGAEAGAYFAGIIANFFKEIYPDPARVRTVPSTAIYELRKTRAPAALVEIAYHDNAEDAQWIKANIGAIARALAQAVTAYFGLPFIEPQAREATVVTSGGNLNIRNYPSYTSSIIGAAPNGARLTINGQSGEWYAIDYQGTVGFVNGAFIIADPD